MRTPLRIVLALVIATAALAALGTGCAKHDSLTRSTAPSTDSVARPGTAYGRAIAARASTRWLAIDGVVGDGIAIEPDGSSSILVLTSRPGVVLPATVQGVPVRTRVTGRFHAFGLTERLRPVPIGASLGSNKECLPGTVGAILERNGRRYVLSANHILARENQARIGEDAVQPSRVDGSNECDALPRRFVIGRLADYEPVHFDGTPNLMDAAIAELNTATTAATPRGMYGAPDDDAVNPAMGMAIMKVGRTTGQTTGTIVATDVEVTLSLPLGDAVYANQFLTTEVFGDFGDSGSLVVTRDRRHHPVGMVIGGDETGSAVCSPIRPILARFHARIARP